MEQQRKNSFESNNSNHSPCHMEEVMIFDYLCLLSLLPINWGVIGMPHLLHFAVCSYLHYIGLQSAHLCRHNNVDDDHLISSSSSSRLSPLSSLLLPLLILPLHYFYIVSIFFVSYFAFCFHTVFSSILMMFLCMFLLNVKDHVFMLSLVSSLLILCSLASCFQLCSSHPNYH